MLNEIIGKQVSVYSGFYSYITSPDVGTVLNIEENWLKLETKREVIFLNENKISRIKIKKNIK